VSENDELDALLEDGFNNLPEDSMEAFVVFENRLRQKFSNNPIETHEAVAYITSIEAFCRVYDILDGYLGDQDAIAIVDRSAVGQYMSMVDLRLSVCKIQIARNRSRGITDTVKLNQNTKVEIRALVESAKVKIDVLDLDARKKDILLDKLNHFLAELDKSQTRLTGLLASMVQVSGAMGDSAEKLEPVVGIFERIMKAVGRGSEPTPKLPKWEEQKQLPSPESFNGVEHTSESEIQ
jgi:hypothetical protein